MTEMALCLPAATHPAGSRRRLAWSASRGDGDSIDASLPWRLCFVPRTVLTRRGWGMREGGGCLRWAGREPDPRWHLHSDTVTGPTTRRNQQAKASRRPCFVVVASERVLSCVWIE